MLNRTRYILILAGLGLILLFINSQIRALNAISQEGQTILIELRPVDPRALMMGDYMALGYAPDALPEYDPDGAPSGQAILRLDAQNVATFARLDDGKLSKGEVRINYARSITGQATYGGPRYYFQEGTAQSYEPAEYGIFKVAPNGRALLVGLADVNYERITPQPNP